jgi:hypothetical protein
MKNDGYVRVLCVFSLYSFDMLCRRGGSGDAQALTRCCPAVCSLPPQPRFLACWIAGLFSNLCRALWPSRVLLVMLAAERPAIVVRGERAVADNRRCAYCADPHRGPQ